MKRGGGGGGGDGGDHAAHRGHSVEQADGHVEQGGGQDGNETEDGKIPGKSYLFAWRDKSGYLAAFFVHSPDLHPALALLCSCKSFRDFKGLWVLQASQ